MKILENHSLKNFNTFGIDVKSKQMIKINSENDLMELEHYGVLAENNFLILGGGSNILFQHDYNGLILIKTK